MKLKLSNFFPRITSKKHIKLLCLISSLTIVIIVLTDLLNRSPYIKEIFNQSSIDWDYYYNDDGLHPQWLFNTSKHYEQSQMRSYSDVIIVQRDRNQPGAMGAPVIVPPTQKELMDKLDKENGFNVLASNMISVRRSMPDMRFLECKSISYPIKLPVASVIIIFHNEPWSTLIRTIWSVIDRSPPELIEEIILVDDASSRDYLQNPLENYIELLPVNIILIRITRREGLIRARLTGAQRAVGHVLVFIDAHVDCLEGWLEPLLNRIANDRSVVAVPHIDHIHIPNMGLIPVDDTYWGFRWNLYFTGFPMPEAEVQRRRYDRTAPFRTMTLIGCAFAIDREFFFEIGAYDTGMDIWGSENLEMALRVWRCGGLLEGIPCSHVTHIFRTSTYSFNEDKNLVKNRKNVRLAEVWLDEFKEYFYAKTPGSRNVQPGDLNERLALKVKLKCKSLSWVLKRIFPDSEWVTGFKFIGKILHIATGKCLDALHGSEGSQIGLYPCDFNSLEQIFSYQKDNQIFSETTSRLSFEQLNLIKYDITPVILQSSISIKVPTKWKYNETDYTIRGENNYCWGNIQSRIYLVPCSTNPEQQWILVPSNKTV